MKDYNLHFIITITFEAKGDKTGVEWIMLFDTPEIRETVVKVHKADEGLQQNVEKLEKYLTELDG